MARATRGKAVRAKPRKPARRVVEGKTAILAKELALVASRLTKLGRTAIEEGHEKLSNEINVLKRVSRASIRRARPPF